MERGREVYFGIWTSSGLWSPSNLTMDGALRSPSHVFRVKEFALFDCLVQNLGEAEGLQPARQENTPVFKPLSPSRFLSKSLVHPSEQMVHLPLAFENLIIHFSALRTEASAGYGGTHFPSCTQEAEAGRAIWVPCPVRSTWWDLITKQNHRTETFDWLASPILRRTGAMPPTAGLSSLEFKP